MCYYYNKTIAKHQLRRTIMIRLATIKDAEQLKHLNDAFNGISDTTPEQIRNSLINNPREIVVVDVEDNLLTYFICVQLKKSFCYNEYMPEITEVYVRPEYRNRGIASAMISFAEDYCVRHYSISGFELLTGKGNLTARSVYEKLGYEDDGEIHLSKQAFPFPT